jgi:hypothetical protein
MSSSIYDKKNSSPVQTRRSQIINDDSQNNRRSLSSKFRDLFRKNSSSPNRTIHNNGQRSPPVSRQRSQSPSLVRPSNEAPHLRAPTVRWPFGKKKNKKRSGPSSLDISNPIHEEQHQTSIRGLNFIPKTPELAHGGTVRSHSSSTFEAGTKGFRDYTVIDHSHQVKFFIDLFFSIKIIFHSFE